jgi:hypothetical protein
MTADEYRRRLLRKAALIALASLTLAMITSALPFPYLFISWPILIVGAFWTRAILRFVETTVWPMPEEEDLE